MTEKERPSFMVHTHTVTFWIIYYELDPEKHYLVDQDHDAIDLDSLFDILNSGIKDYSITPQEIIPNNHNWGDVSINIVIIRDEDGKEVYRHKNFKEELVPDENRLS